MKNISRTLKITTLVLSGMLMLGGCGADKTEQTPPAEVETVQSTQNETQESQTTISSVENATENQDMDGVAGEVADNAVPTVAVTQDKKRWYTDDNEVLLLEAEASKVEVLGDGFDALKDSLAAQWNGLGDNYDEVLEWAKDHYESLEKGEDSYFTNYAVTQNVGVYRIDDHVISLCESEYQYTGGAHGIYGNYGRTFDVKSGKELQLEDLLSDPEGFYDKAVDYIIDNLEKNYGEELFPEYEETVRTDTFGETPVSWYLDDTGIVIDYALYMIAPYVAGMPSVTLPYEEFAAYIKEDYISPRSSLIVKVSENEDFSRMIGENGKVMLETVWNEEYGASEVTVVSGNASEEVGSFAQFEGAYAIKREDGRSFLIFVCDYASDDFVTYVYEVTGGNVQKCDELNGASLGDSYSGDFCIGTDRIGLSMHLDVLGTYSGFMPYLLTEDGKLTQTEDIFAIDTFYELTVIKELPVTLEGEETTIPSGSKIKITGTDNAGNACFLLDTGETGVIKYVRDNEQWQLLIDGVSENAYFEMVPYAG